MNSHAAMKPHATAKSGTDTSRRRVAELARLLDQLRGLYDELFTLIERKIDAMRNANWSALTECNQRADAVARRIAERDGLRKQLLDAIGVDLGLPPRMGRTLTITRLCERIPADLGRALRTAADRLHPALARTAQANRVAGFAARGLVHHLRWVFEAVSPRCEGDGYSGDGVTTARPGARLVDTVG